MLIVDSPYKVIQEEFVTAHPLDIQTSFHDRNMFENIQTKKKYV